MSNFLVVGAGPAGMAAAITAANNGANVTVVDNRPAPGGNIYSNILANRQNNGKLWKALGASYREGAPLIDAFLSSNVTYLPSHALWHLDPDGHASARGSNGLVTFNAGKVVLATGAQERPLPLNGWTKPGVMGVGAAQVLMKANGTLPKGPIVIVGDGPLPLLYAAQVLALGGQIAAFVLPELTQSFTQAARHFQGAWHGRSYLVKGLGYLVRRTLARVPIYKDARDIQIIGDGQTEGLRFKTKTEHELRAETVLIHDGVIPNVNPGSAAGLTLERNTNQDSWHPKSNDTIQVAGDAGGILGAKAAHLSGITAAHRLMGQTVPDDVTRKLEKERKFRAFIDQVYPPLGNCKLADGDTIICRCEAVRKNQIQEVARNIGTDPNRLKTSLRCGMGPCQGRMCGLSVERIISDVTGTEISDVGLHRIRNPIVPVTMGHLAQAKCDKGR